MGAVPLPAVAPALTHAADFDGTDSALDRGASSVSDHLATTLNAVVLDLMVQRRCMDRQRCTFWEKPGATVNRTKMDMNASPRELRPVTIEFRWNDAGRSPAPLSQFVLPSGLITSLGPF